jgi:hypothetical protein
VVTTTRVTDKALSAYKRLGDLRASATVLIHLLISADESCATVREQYALTRSSRCTEFPEHLRDMLGREQMK